MQTFYDQLEIDPTASQEAITAAYQRQCEQYNPERVANIDTELHQVAAQRRTELARIYAVLSDPVRRHQYDMSIGRVAAAAPPQRGLSARERWYALGGVVAAIILVSVMWIVTGRNPAPAPAMGEVNRPAPDIALTTLGGGDVRLANLQGNIVLVNFWGSWCDPCKREMPALQSAYERLKGRGFTIIGVNLTDDERTRGVTEAQLQAFVAQFGVTYPIALDVGGEVTNAYHIYPLPTSFFIDSRGQIRYVRVGELSYDDVVARFEQLRREAQTSAGL